jgi:hypothetical protein
MVSLEIWCYLFSRPIVAWLEKIGQITWSLEGVEAYSHFPFKCTI